MYQLSNAAAPEVATAAERVAAAIREFARTAEQWESANGPRGDHWATEYPAQRDATEEAEAWADYAETLRAVVLSDTATTDTA